MSAPKHIRLTFFGLLIAVSTVIQSSSIAVAHSGCERWWDTDLDGYQIRGDEHANTADSCDGSNYGDIIYVYGAGDNSNGNDVSDSLHMGNGSDYGYGGNGPDWVYGGAGGFDNLYGNNGNDTIYDNTSEINGDADQVFGGPNSDWADIADSDYSDAFFGGEGDDVNCPEIDINIGGGPADAVDMGPDEDYNGQFCETI